MASEVTVITPEQRDLAMVEVTSHLVACNGGGGPLGHPLTYYEVTSEKPARCNYCDKQFVFIAPVRESHG